MASLIDSALGVTSVVGSILSSVESAVSVTVGDVDTDTDTTTATTTHTPASASLTDSTFSTSAETGAASTPGASSTQAESGAPPSSTPSEPATYYIQKYGLSTGAKAGIAIGAVALFIMILVAVLLVRRRRYQKRSYRLGSVVPGPPVRDVGDEAPSPVMERLHVPPVAEMYSPVIERLNPPPYSETGQHELSSTGQAEHQGLSYLRQNPELHGTSLSRNEGGYPSQQEVGVTRSRQHSAELQVGKLAFVRRQISGSELMRLFHRDRYRNTTHISVRQSWIRRIDDRTRVITQHQQDFLVPFLHIILSVTSAAATCHGSMSLPATINVEHARFPSQTSKAKQYTISPLLYHRSSAPSGFLQIGE